MQKKLNQMARQLKPSKCSNKIPVEHKLVEMSAHKLKRKRKLTQISKMNQNSRICGFIFYAK